MMKSELQGTRHTQNKGDRAKAQAIATFTRMGFDVAILITESAPYDIIVDDGEQRQRVQVKYSSSRAVDLRCIHSNSTGYVVKKYADNVFDWLYVLKPDGVEYLIKRKLNGNSYITPTESEKI